MIPFEVWCVIAFGVLLAMLSGDDSDNDPSIQMIREEKKNRKLNRSMDE